MSAKGGKGVKSRALTLLELLVVVVVLAVIALVAVPRFQSVLFGARETVVEKSAESVAREANALSVFNTDAMETTDANIDAALTAADLNPAEGWAVSTEENSVSLTKAGDVSVAYVCLSTDTTPTRAVASATACGAGGGGGGGEASAPGAPTAVSLTAGDTELAVSWAAPTSDGGSPITGYTATTDPGGFTCTASSPSTSCTITGLTNGTSYTVTVAATNAVGTSAPAAAGGAAVPLGVPGAPQSVAAVARDASADISWTSPASTGGEVSTYIATATASGQATQSCSTGGATSCTITGLTNNVAYTVSVTAGNSSGTGPAATTTVTPYPFTITEIANALPSSANWTAITWTGTTFLALKNASSFTVASSSVWNNPPSTPTMTWNTVSPSPTVPSGSFGTMASSASTRIAIRSDAASLVWRNRAVDGFGSWSQENSGLVSKTWVGIAYDSSDGVWVLIASDGTVRRSTNEGNNWSAPLGTVPTGDTITALSHSNGVWLAPTTTGSLWRSTDDGQSWSEVFVPGLTRRWEGVAEAGGVWAATGRSSTNIPVVSRSTDGGVTWSTSVALIGSTVSSPFVVAGGDGRFLAVAGGIATTSTDGTTWATTFTSGTAWSDIAYGSGMFVVTAGGSATRTVLVAR